MALSILIFVEAVSIKKTAYILKQLSFGLFKKKFRLKLNLSQVLSCTEKEMCVGGGESSFDKFYHPLHFMLYVSWFLSIEDLLFQIRQAIYFYIHSLEEGIITSGLKIKKKPAF